MNYEKLSVNEKVTIRNLLKEQVENGFVNKAMDFNVKIYLEAIKVAVLANCPDGIDDTLFGQKIDISINEDNIDPLIDIDLFDNQCSSPDLSDDTWEEILLPNYIEKILGSFDGVVWFRKAVEIPKSWIGKDLILSLGPIDDRDAVWFNGTKIGETAEHGKWTENRIYTIDGKLVTQEKNIFSIRVLDTGGRGGIYGDASLLKIYPVNSEKTALSLAGEWKYKIVAELMNNNLYVFELNKTDFNLRPQRSITIDQNTPSVLFNGMIAPIVAYKIKGAIWYQGESNVGSANQYTKMMETLISNWRRSFNIENFPFYFVQIAPYKYSNPQNSESAWLREAQRRILNTENTGMVVTLDVGNVENIHPADKISVGERLALWALAKNYGIDVEYSGPRFNDKFTVRKNELTVEFDYAENGFIIKNETPNQFEIAGENGVYYPATALIYGNSIILSSPKVENPVNARYAFTNGSTATLFNSSGLPASSFTTEKIFPD